MSNCVDSKSTLFNEPGGKAGVRHDGKRDRRPTPLLRRFPIEGLSRRAQVPQLARAKCCSSRYVSARRVALALRQTVWQMARSRSPSLFEHHPSLSASRPRQPSSPRRAVRPRGMTRPTMGTRFGRPGATAARAPVPAAGAAPQAAPPSGRRTPLRVGRSRLRSSRPPNAHRSAERQFSPDQLPAVPRQQR